MVSVTDYSVSIPISEILCSKLILKENKNLNDYELGELHSLTIKKCL